ncbi:ZinT/AdcA family metal-binding protein [Salinicoccus sp. RF5]|nr:ZinT/AdcA family metal-binding protein [Salinicoccus sp. RF5]MCC4722247.1 metal-binding protein ZinT [Salinicoccus sp. RF5]
MPNYIQFSDHSIFPVESDHFHIHTDNDGALEMLC